jgi:hypothetical protein
LSSASTLEKKQVPHPAIRKVRGWFGMTAKNFRRNREVRPAVPAIAAPGLFL